MAPWTFHSGGSLTFGRDSVQQLGAVAGRLGAKRVFVVTDPILVQSGLVDRVAGPLVREVCSSFQNIARSLTGRLANSRIRAPGHDPEQRLRGRLPRHDLRTDAQDDLIVTRR